MAVLTGPVAGTTTQPKANYPYINPNNPDEVLPLVNNQQNQTQPNSGGPQPTQPGVMQTPQPGQTQAPQVQPGQVQPVNSSFQQQPGQNLNQQVLQTAQNKAIQGFQSPLMGQVEQRTGQFLANPLGYDKEAYKKTQMELFDKDRADTFEMLRQGLGDISNTGAAQGEMRRQALEGSAAKAQFGSKLDQDLATQEREALIKALAEGRSTVGQQSDIYSQGIGLLNQTRNAAEGEETRKFTGSENAIDRGLKIALANQDAALQTSLTELKGKIDAGMQLTQNDFTASQNALSRSLQEAMQRNDINATRENIQTQLAFDKWKTEAGFSFTAEQNAMNRALETSLKTMDIEGQKSLVELKGKIDKDMLLTGQDFQSVQAELDRALERETNAGNWANAFEIEQMKQEFTAIENAKQREYQTAERTATQSWQTSERLDTQSYNRATQLLDQQFQTALQSNDIASQERIENSRQLLQLKMQTAEFGQMEKMAYLNSQIAEAKANNDVGRQMTLMTFQHGQEMEKITSAQGFEAGQAYLQRNHDLAMQNNDHTQAMAITQLQIKATAEENMKDRVLEQAKIDLQKYGMNIAAIQAEVEAGRLDPEAAIQQIQASVGDGYTLNAVDSTQAALSAIDADMKLQQYQFGLTNPQYMNADGKTLNDAGLAAFNKQFNAAAYGDRAQDILNGTIQAGTLKGQGGDNPSTEYQTVLNQAPVISATTYVKKQDGINNDAHVLTGHDSMSIGGFVNYNGMLYQVMSISQDKNAGANNTVYTFKDVNTGKTETITAK